MSRRAAALASDDPELRLRAIAEIGAAAEALDADDLRALIACLAHPRKAVQRPAGELCAALGAVSREPLVEAIRAGDPRLRWGATWALSRLDATAAELLAPALEALGSPDGDVRWAAAEIVGRLARTSAEVEDLLLRALDEDPPERRKMALYCLRDLGAEKALATEARRHGEEAHDARTATPSPGRRGRDGEGAHLLDARRSALLRTLHDPDEGVVLAALSAIARLVPDEAETVEAVLALLDSPNERLQRAAASALGMVGRASEEAENALARLAASPDPSLRRAAEQARARRRLP